MFLNLLLNMLIHFISLDKNIIHLFPKIFANLPNISFSVGNIQNCNAFDCIVSPANSFGHMDGGIDAVLSHMLAKNNDYKYIGRKVRKNIKEKYAGEQPIGTCLLVKTKNEKYPFLAHAPTMTIPENVNKTLNAYYAFKSVLCCVINHNKKSNHKINSILTTTFCTGCGDMDLETSLKQMRYAYDVVCNPIKGKWDYANNHILNLRDLK